EGLRDYAAWLPGCASTSSAAARRLRRQQGSLPLRARQHSGRPRASRGAGCPRRWRPPHALPPPASIRWRASRARPHRSRKPTRHRVDPEEMLADANEIAVRELDVFAEREIGPVRRVEVGDRKVPGRGVATEHGVPTRKEWVRGEYDVARLTTHER